MTIITLCSHTTPQNLHSRRTQTKIHHKSFQLVLTQTCHFHLTPLQLLWHHRPQRSTLPIPTNHHATFHHMEIPKHIPNHAQQRHPNVHHRISRRQNLSTITHTMAIRHTHCPTQNHQNTHKLPHRKANGTTPTSTKNTYLILDVPFQHYKNRQPPKQHTQQYWYHINYRQTGVVKQWDTNLPKPSQIHYIVSEQPNSWLYNHQTVFPPEIVVHTETPRRSQIDSDYFPEAHYLFLKQLHHAKLLYVRTPQSRNYETPWDHLPMIHPPLKATSYNGYAYLLVYCYEPHPLIPTL